MSVLKFNSALKTVNSLIELENYPNPTNGLEIDVLGMGIYKYSTLDSKWYKISSEQLPTPELKSLDKTHSNTKLTVEITNYDSTLKYQIDTSVGTFTRENEFIYWDIPYIDDGQVYIVVNSFDTVNDLLPSDINKHIITIENPPLSGTQMLYLTKSNLDVFTKLNGIKLIPIYELVPPDNILKTTEVQTVDKIQIDNSKVDLFNGDTVLLDGVENRVNNLTALLENDNVFTIYNFTPESVISVPPTDCKLKVNRMSTPVIKQLEGLPDFKSIRDITLVETGKDILDLNTTSEISILITDDVLVGDLVIDQDANIRTVISVSGNNIVLDSGFPIVPTKLYRLTTIRFNDIKLSIDSVNLYDGKITYKFNSVDITEFKITIDLFKNEIESFTAEIETVGNLGTLPIELV